MFQKRNPHLTLRTTEAAMRETMRQAQEIGFQPLDLRSS
jgi:hypothetical protein